MVEDLVAFVQTLHAHAVPRTATRTLVLVLRLPSESVMARGVPVLWTVVVDGFGLAGVATRARTFAVAVVACRGFTAAAVTSFGTVTVQACKWSWSMDLGQARRGRSRVIEGS
jgi:hypothetical protein